MRGKYLCVIALILAIQGLAQNPATTVNVDASANRLAINPNIYGIAYGDAHDMATLNAPLNRWGGDATSRYNWQIDAHSAGADWYFETYSDGSGTPAGSADAYVATTRSNTGSEPLFTIPMIDYIANLGPNRTTLEGFSVKKYGPQTATDPYNSDAGNGVSSATGNDITGNNPLDTGVANSTTIQQGWLQHFISTYGVATSSTGIKYYILDNEPSLWYSTHRDVHPNPANYQEMYNKIVAYASVIKAADPSAKVVGPEEWSWWAMYASGFDQANGFSAANSDYNTHNQTYYYPWLLKQLYAYKQQTGVQLLDVLTVHCYNGAPASNDDSAAGQAYRNQETRILWDPTFQDPSWYGDIGINGRVINWIPTMKAMVSQYFPGLEIGCTEYNWGDEPNLNGATTQADVLGIYGREGFDLATRWTVATNTSTTPSTYYVTYLASQIYHNYDGNQSTFGDTSVEATVVDPDNLSSFASVRSSDGALTVMVINKQQGATPVTVSLANFSTSGTAQAWQINATSQTSITRLADLTVASNSISTTVPSQSITLLVIPAGSTLSAPSAPTGLAASVGNGTVTLIWNAAGGATSYAVKRSATSGGSYTTIATQSGSSTSFTDTGLTNGTTYYYVVAGSNSAGTSPNSSPVSATPLVPPTFSSSATANPNPVTQGIATTVSATVKDSTNSLASGIVQIVVLDPTGATALTQNFTGQNFATGQSLPYSVSLTPALAGAYTVEIGVFSSTSQLWNWNSSAATITVNSNLTFNSSAAPSPSTFAAGASTSIAVSVTETGAGTLTNSIVELQVFNTAGTAVMTTFWTGQNFAAGQTLKFSYTWNSTSTLPVGTYSVDIGVFNSDWSQNYYWNGSAGSLKIATPSGTSKVGIFRGGFFWLLDTDGNRQWDDPPDQAFAYGGIAGDIPITGDWTGDGHTKAGIYRAKNGDFILDTNGDEVFDTGDAVHKFLQNVGGPQAGDVPVVGDWNGSGTSKIGIVRDGFLWLLDLNGDGIYEPGTDLQYVFGGAPGDIPVVGDWTGTGTSKIGVLREGFFWLLDANGNGTWDGTTGGDYAFAFGAPGDVPVVGDWTGDGVSKVGMYRDGFLWVLDSADPSVTSATGQAPLMAFPFGGIAGDVPIVGKWFAPPATLTASGGTPQSAAINSAFATPLAVQVTGVDGYPQSGVTVQFTVPGSGPAATFAGNASTAITNEAGVATSAILTANGTADGPYSVTASVLSCGAYPGCPGSASPAIFTLTNTAAPELRSPQRPK